MNEKEQVQYASALFDGARMYVASADAINDKYPNAIHVLSHQLGMSIELALKAFLVINSISEKELRKIGHDLGLLYKKAQEYGLLYTGSRSFQLRVLGQNYKSRIFAYPQEGNLTIINPKNLREIVHEIIIEVFQVLKGDKQLKRNMKQPGLCILSKYPETIYPSAWAVKEVK